MRQERRQNLAKRTMFERMCVDLLARLHRVRGQLTERELRALAARMTRIRLKYEPWVGLPSGA
jgi:hypothetical protein